MQDLKKQIAERIGEKIKESFGAALPAQEIQGLLEYPPDAQMGDVALPCFALSKTLRRAPAQIASALAEGLEVPHCERVSVVSGYLNFFVSDLYRAGHVLAAIANDGEYGKNRVGENKTMCIDYSSPNMAKPFHIGHLGTTAIGNAIKNIFAFCGYRCVGINYLGDWGTQYGRLAVAYEKWGNREEVEKNGVKELVRLYQRFYVEAESDPALNDRARARFSEMEQGNPEALEIWRWFRELSLKEFMKTYDLLGISFDSYSGESFYNDKMPAVVQELRDKGLLTESDGAMIVSLEEYNMPPCLILKSDGSTLYATRDIAAALYRKKTYQFDKCLYVTDAGQSLHFAQFFKVISLMGHGMEDQLVHIPYGKISVGGQKLATRAGNAVLLEELFGEAIRRVRQIMEEKNPDCADKEEIAKRVGVGAVIFNQLSTGRIKDINFIWEEALNFDGNTGPYVQYTYARACGVLEKSEPPEDCGAVYDGALSMEERAVIHTLSLFPDKVLQAHNDYEPSVIARYLLDVCHDFNRFYHSCPILRQVGALRDMRIQICRGAKNVIGNGLALLGIQRTETI